MIKFMDRSILYYIKRPVFSLSLLYSKRPVRMYSIFVMDLIEQDLVKYEPNYSRYGSDWTIKGSTKRVNLDSINSYVRTILYRKEEQEKEFLYEQRIKNMIRDQITDIEGSTK